MRLVKPFHTITVNIIVAAAILAGSVSCSEKLTNTKTLTPVFKQNFADAVQQYKLLKDSLPGNTFPRSFENNKLITSNSGWWCSGFYPGSLLYLYEETGDTVMFNEAMRMLTLLEKEQYNTRTHDLGFMMFCSFGAANRLNPSEKYQQILVNSAKSLASRFSPVTKCIRSWDSAPQDFLVIIDNMMNLELLFWATQHTGDSSFYKIALTHANTTLKNHFRADYSSHHVLNYDGVTGNVKEKKTAQGYSDSSTWARGQAWGLYGYTVMYRFTHDKQYLEQAKNIASFMLHHPNLPADKISYWDFNAPNIPDAKRDASAAAITASALLELLTYVDDEQKLYYTTAETILKNLSSPDYKAPLKTNGGFILQHSVGHFSKGSEVDVPLTYADYYFIEAMKRYKALRF